MDLKKNEVRTMKPTTELAIESIDQSLKDLVEVMDNIKNILARIENDLEKRDVFEGEPV